MKKGSRRNWETSRGFQVAQESKRNSFLQERKTTEKEDD